MVQFRRFARNRATTIDDQMTTAPISVPSSEFNDFLFAPIGEDKNGMLVSVLSGLARSDVDPWQEAAKLAQLPGDAATRELAALIGALPDRAAPFPDPRTIATRLIALLPRRFGSSGRMQQAPPHSAWAVMNSRPWWIYVAFMCFVLSSQFLIANHPLPAKSDSMKETAANPAVPPAPPVNSGQ
jgi:hypothetical protein